MFQITFKARESMDHFKLFRNFKVWFSPNLSKFTISFATSGSKFSQIFDPKPLSYIDTRFTL